MANNKSSKDDGKDKDPREAFEQAGQQMFEVLNKGFNDALGLLQDVSSTIEERLEEVFGPRPGSKGSSKAKADASSDVVDATAKKVPTKKKAVANTVAAKKAPAKKKPAAKKATAKKVAAKKAPAKKATAKKVAAKKTPAKKATAKRATAKKVAAKKVPATKKPAAKRAPSGATREELYDQAQKLNIAGRSKMSKAQLQKAIKAAKS